MIALRAWVPGPPSKGAVPRMLALRGGPGGAGSGVCDGATSTGLQSGACAPGSGVLRAFEGVGAGVGWWCRGALGCFRGWSGPNRGRGLYLG